MRPGGREGAGTDWPSWVHLSSGCWRAVELQELQGALEISQIPVAHHICEQTEV